MMTPSLEPGEVFRTPGPIALGMIRDMLQTPPIQSATGLPAKPVNLRALVGDNYAILTFDSPNCSRVDRIKSYTVTISPGGESRTFDTSPIRINGLKNGKSYKFTLVAENEKGSSDPVESNSVKPQASGKLTVVDQFSRVASLASTMYKGKPTLVYGDEATRSLKIATLSSGKWRVSTARKGMDVGEISLCKSGSGASETLHVFYGETTKQDLIHSYLRSSKWKHETVDGNGEDIQDYREELRRKSASDVSVSNACVVTQQALQVFYRDESQGILLGAAKTSNGWVYEIVDGDKDEDNRTTGDVAFHISAVSEKNTVYLLYDSVLTINSNRDATSGEVRLATRKTIFPEDWRYQTLDGPDNGSAVAGYATGIYNNKGKIMAAWMVSKGDSLPDPSQVVYSEVGETPVPYTLTPTAFGTPSSPLSLDAKGLAFGCFNRLCAASFSSRTINLANGNTDFTEVGQIIIIGKARYIAAISNKRIVLVKI
jgi:hypothetical protein